MARKLDMIDTEANVMRTFNDFQEESSLSFVKLKVDAEHPFVGKTLAQIGAIESMLVALILRHGNNPIIPNGNTVIEQEICWYSLLPPSNQVSKSLCASSLLANIIVGAIKLCAICLPNATALLL